MEVKQVKPGKQVINWQQIKDGKGLKPIETIIVSGPYRANGTIVCDTSGKRRVPVERLQVIY